MHLLFCTLEGVLDTMQWIGRNIRTDASFRENQGECLRFAGGRHSFRSGNLHTCPGIKALEQCNTTCDGERGFV